MSDAPPSAGGGLIGAAERIGIVLTHSLPPAFLMLVLLNLMFLLGLMWFLDARQAAVAITVNRIVDNCMMAQRFAPPTAKGN